MAQAAITVFDAILKDGTSPRFIVSRFVSTTKRGATGTQEAVVGKMQTREDLYKAIDYYSYEKKLDDLFGPGDKSKL